LIRTAYAQAGIDPRDTGYVEAHGTGTGAGDLLEAGAIADVFGQGRDSSNPVYVGSIKTNCGHLEGASGLAGIIKSTMMLERGEIPPNLNFEKRNNRIPLEDWNLRV
jgi:acyl transferase domain-containing protein